MLVSFLVTLFSPLTALTDSKTDTKYWLGLCPCRWCQDIGTVKDAHSPVCRQAMAPDVVPISTSLLLQFSTVTACVYTCFCFYVIQRGDGIHMLSSENSGCMIAYSHIVLLFNWPAVNDRGIQEGADALIQPFRTGVRQASRHLVGQRSFWQDGTVEGTSWGLVLYHLHTGLECKGILSKKKFSSYLPENASVIRTNQSTLLRETIFVYCGNRMKHATQCDKIHSLNSTEGDTCS